MLEKRANSRPPRRQRTRTVDSQQRAKNRESAQRRHRRANAMPSRKSPRRRRRQEAVPAAKKGGKKHPKPDGDQEEGISRRLLPKSRRNRSSGVEVEGIAIHRRNRRPRIRRRFVSTSAPSSRRTTRRPPRTRRTSGTRIKQGLLRMLGGYWPCLPQKGRPWSSARRPAWRCRLHLLVLVGALREAPEGSARRPRRTLVLPEGMPPLLVSCRRRRWTTCPLA